MAVHADLKFFATVASIVYGVSLVIMLIILTIFTYKSEAYQNQSHSTVMSAVCSKRGIYGQVLVHIYDTATDIGVLIGWGILAYDNNDYESIDMLAHFWTCIGFMITYRILSMCFGMGVAYQDGKPVQFVSNCCLALFDFYIFRVIYEALTQEATEPTPRQKFIQLVESIFESLPQVVLQSVFIIRAQNDIILKDNSNILLVGLSLLGSLLSISTKLAWIDKNCVKDDAKEPEWDKSYVFVNKWYVLRIVWRYSFVTARFAIFSLVWSVMGGKFAIIFIALSFLYWGISGILNLLSDQKVDIDCTNCCLASLGLGLIMFMYGSVCLISTPASNSKKLAIMHVIETILVMSLITWFANSNINCGICVDPEIRQASSNEYILMFMICGWIAMTIDFLTYFLLLKFERLEELDFERIFKFFDRGFGQIQN